MGVVVVGTSFGCITHVRALRAAGLEVVALVGRDPDRTAERAARFEVPHATTSLAEALALPDVDAVTVATPPHTHCALVLEALDAGKHVVCEKPFAADLDQAHRMLAAAETAGIVHLLGTEFRWATGQALMARLVAQGAIGDPRLATFLLHIPLLADPAAEVPEWWSDAGQGGGWLGAQATHVIDQIRATLGEIDGVSATLRVLADRDWTAEDTLHRPLPAAERWARRPAGDRRRLGVDPAGQPGGRFVRHGVGRGRHRVAGRRHRDPHRRGARRPRSPAVGPAAQRPPRHVL